jgi:hypothetical protein
MVEQGTGSVDKRPTTRNELTMARQLRLSTTTGFLFIVWTLIVGPGVFLLGMYHARPGDAGTPRAGWPPFSHVRRDVGRPTLLMFLHPHCPCSQASVSELERLVTHCHGRSVFSAYVIVVKPSRGTGTWEQTVLERKAAAIPGVVLRDDLGGVEAQAFGVSTSGHTLVYDQDGALAFSGGVTPARAHEGGNYGLEAVVELLSGRPATHREHPVFGCPLFSHPHGRDPEVFR